MNVSRENMRIFGKTFLLMCMLFLLVAIVHAYSETDDGFYINNNEHNVLINKPGGCRYVNNTAGITAFIPTLYSGEWTSTFTNQPNPPGVTFDPCWTCFDVSAEFWDGYDVDNYYPWGAYQFCRWDDSSDAFLSDHTIVCHDDQGIDCKDYPSHSATYSDYVQSYQDNLDNNDNACVDSIASYIDLSEWAYSGTHEPYQRITAISDLRYCPPGS